MYLCVCMNTYGWWYNGFFCGCVILGYFKGCGRSVCCLLIMVSPVASDSLDDYCVWFGLVFDEYLICWRVIRTCVILGFLGVREWLGPVWSLFMGMMVGCVDLWILGFWVLGFGFGMIEWVRRVWHCNWDLCVIIASLFLKLWYLISRSYFSSVLLSLCQR